MEGYKEIMCDAAEQFEWEKMDSGSDMNNMPFIRPERMRGSAETLQSRSRGVKCGGAKDPEHNMESEGIRNEDDEDEDERTGSVHHRGEATEEKRKINRNVWSLNVGFFFCWAALSGLSIIQSSVVGTVGTVGLAVNFAFSVLGCTILAPMFIRLFGCKKSILIGVCTLIIWELSNFYPTWATVLPGAALSGAGLGPMFTAQGTFCSNQGKMYSQLSGETEEAAIGRFFGFFFSLLLLSVSVGCLITSAIFNIDFGDGVQLSESGLISNWTAGVDEVLLGPMEHCGANFCPWTYDSMWPVLNTTLHGNTSLDETFDEELITPIQRYVLVAVHISMTVIGGIVIYFGMADARTGEVTSGEGAWSEAKASILVTVKQCKRRRQLLMTPLNIYIGIMQSFSLADLTNAYVVCAIGVEMTGFALATYGVVACAASVLSGFLLQKTGRIPLYTFALLLRLATHLLLLFWVPDSSQMAMFFIIPAVWSMADAMLISLTNSFYGTIFLDSTEGAFSAYRFWEAIGFVIGYLYNSAICVDTKIYVMTLFFLVGAILYYVTEYLQRRLDREKPTATQSVELDTKEGGPRYPGQAEAPSWTHEASLTTDSEVVVGEKKKYIGLSTGSQSSVVLDAEPEEEPAAAAAAAADNQKQRGRILKSVWAINWAFFCGWSALSGLSIIQSSVVGVVGTVGLAVNFGSSVLGCTIAAPLSVRLLGCRWSILIGLVSLVAFELAQYYPTWGTVIPGALLSGIAMGPMFTGQGTFCTKAGIRYAKLTGETQEAVVGRFFGFFFCLLLVSVSVGCFITGFVLSTDFGDGPQFSDTVGGALWTNMTSYTAAEELGPLPHCGAGFCPWPQEPITSPFNVTSLNRTMTSDDTEEQLITPRQRYVLVSVHLGMTILGGLLTFFLVEDLPMDAEALGAATKGPWHEAKQSMLVTLRQCKRGRQLLMTPLNVYIGIMQSFALADITNAFIVCAVGVQMSGYTMVTYGFVACGVSVASGLLLSRTGRIPQYTFALLLRFGLTLFMLFWTPDPRYMAVFVLIPSLWAVSDSMLISLTNSFYGTIFTDNTDGAFGAYRFWEAIGFVLGYIYNTAICADTKIYVLLVFQLVGWVLYYATEYVQKRLDKRQRRLDVTTAGATADDKPEAEGNTERLLSNTNETKTAEADLDSFAFGDIISGFSSSLTASTNRLLKFKINKSIWTLNVAFFFGWTALCGLTIIQSSVVGVVGTVGLAVNFAFSVLGCTLVAPLSIRLLGCKVSLLVGFGTLILWEVSNYYPTWGTVVPAAIISGLGIGPMFSAQGVYCTKAGVLYARSSGQKDEDIIGRFFGFFFCLLLVAVSFGCVVTSVILSADFGDGAETVDSVMAGLSTNQSWAAELGPLTHCGAGYCPEQGDTGNPAQNFTSNDTMGLYSEVELITPLQRFTLVSVHTALTVLGAVLLFLFLDDLPSDKAAEAVGSKEGAWSEAKDSVLVTFRQCKRPRQLLMTPLNIYIGMQQSFTLADLTNAYIGCALGVDMTGYALVLYGFVACAASLLSGYLLKYTGRIPLFSFALLLRLVMEFVLLAWVPDPSQLAVFFIIPALWSISDSMIISLTNGFYGIMFVKDPDGAFAAYRFWEAIGFVIGYAYVSAICVDTKIYILVSVHVVGGALYYVTEWVHRRSGKESQEDADGKRPQSQEAGGNMEAWEEKYKNARWSVLLVDARESVV